MPLITRLANGSPLSTIQMDGNLDYLNTNMSGSNLTLSGSVEISGSLSVNGNPLPNYKVLVSTFEQTGTSDPVLGIFESTLTEAPTTNRVSAGKYEILSSDFAVIANVFMAGMSDWWGNGNTVITLSDEASILGYVSIYPAVGKIRVFVLSPTWVYTDWSVIMDATKLMLPEIKVYS